MLQMTDPLLRDHGAKARRRGRRQRERARGGHGSSARSGAGEVDRGRHLVTRRCGHGGAESCTIIRLFSHNCFRRRIRTRPGREERPTFLPGRVDLVEGIRCGICQLGHLLSSKPSLQIMPAMPIGGYHRDPYNNAWHGGRIAGKVQHCDNRYFTSNHGRQEAYHAPRNVGTGRRGLFKSAMAPVTTLAVVNQPVLFYAEVCYGSRNVKTFAGLLASSSHLWALLLLTENPP
jgi:hypothetical protein